MPSLATRRSTLEHVPERLVESRLDEPIAEPLQDDRQRALPGGHDLPHLPVQELEREAGDRQHRWTPEDVTERASQLCVRDRVGRGHVDGTGRASVVERAPQGADDVVEVDPRDVLAATGDRAAET